MSNQQEQPDPNFEESMDLIERLDKTCEGVDYFNMLYSMTYILAELIVEMEKVYGIEKPMKTFGGLFNDFLTDNRQMQDLEELDEEELTRH